MPDLVMHHYFGRELLKALNQDIKAQITNLPLYDFATAGPDPFFFVSFWNKTKNSVSLGFGNNMHRVKTREFFNKLTEITINDQKMFSYLCGLIAHFALDTKAHPYVFHKTGVYDVNNPQTLIYRGLHTKLERAMDSYIIRNKYHAIPYKFKIYKRILTLKKLDKSYQNALDQLYLTVFNHQDGYKHVNKSIKDQRRFYKFIYDPWGIKQKLLTKLDNGKSTLDLKVLSYYKKELIDIDIFNEAHNFWCNPVKQELTSNQSFFDLFQDAIQMATALITNVYQVIFRKQSLDEQMFPNVNYLDGLDCDLNMQMQYFSNIFS
jgi:hypothetical protein